MGNRKIQVYRMDGHFEFVKRTFDLFQQPRINDRAKKAATYLIAWLLDHLGVLYEATGLDELQPADKQYIASHLFDMFNEPDHIDKVWDIREYIIWYREEQEIDEFWKWLDDPVAVRHLGPRDRRWLRDMKDEKHRNRRLLTPLMTTVARNWLQVGKGETWNSWEAWELYGWIEKFLAMGSKEDLCEDDDGRQPIENDEEIMIYSGDSEDDAMVKVEQWCMRALNIREGDLACCICLARCWDRMGRGEAAQEKYRQAVTLLQTQDPVDNIQLRDAFLALGRLSSDAESALEYFSQAYQQDEGNMVTLYHLLKQYIATSKEDEAKSIVQMALNEKASEADFTKLTFILKMAVADRNSQSILDVFRAISILLSSSPDHWDALQHDLEAAVEDARKEHRHDELAILLLQLGNARHHLRSDYSEDADKAVLHWRECLTTIRGIVSGEEKERLDFVAQLAVRQISTFCFERAIQADGAERQEHEQNLLEVYGSNRQNPRIQHLVASFFAYTDRPHKARELLRSQMVAAFNILSDNDDGNDKEGYLALRGILGHIGDYDNARKASLMVPPRCFNREILEVTLDEVLEETTEEGKPLLESARVHLSTFYDEQCLDINKETDNCATVLQEVERQTETAEPDSESASVWGRILSSIQKVRYSWSTMELWCQDCDRFWNYEVGIYTCKYCYNINLCDVCWKKLQSEKTHKIHVCSKLHDWWYLEPWTKENDTRAKRRLIPMKTEDGGEEFISASKWLGGLCEEWGLRKEDWGFE